MLYIKEMKDSNPGKCPESYLYYMNAYEASLKKFIQIYTSPLDLSGFLEKLSKDYYLCILTNENLRTQLIKLDGVSGSIVQFIDKILTSEEVGVEKPDLKIFRELEKVFQSKSGLPYIMVGDSVAADVVPALSLGWKAAQMTQFVEDPTPHLGKKVSSFDQLLVWLGSM
jgi:HAD superfamily hydrolase (TIGR01549 family)